MAGFDSSPSESEYGFSCPHLIGLACLGTGVVAILVFSAFSEPEHLREPDVKSLLVASPVEAGSQDERKSPAISSMDTLSKSQKSPFLETPAIAERLPSEQRPRKVVTQELVAAIAEKASRPEREIKLLPNWNHFTEYELEANLLRRVPEIGLDLNQAKEAISKVSQTTEKDASVRGPDPHVLALLEETQVEGLPIQTNRACQLDEKAGSELQKHSRGVQAMIARHKGSSPISSRQAQSLSYLTQQQSGIANAIKNEKVFHDETAVPALVQILQIESSHVRYQLVETLNTHKSADATQRLLNRALYDLSQEVRHAANEALRERPPAEFRAELLKAFRYPWEPVAWHAAETLMQIQDKKAIPALIELLDAPDPAAPFRDGSGKMRVRELVKVNHLRNCLLCHAQAHSPKDLVVAPVPEPGKPLPQVYYSRSLRSRSVVVRADVTYLRQDFSLLQNVELQDLERRGRWPDQQRFDYFVRTRDANPDEIEIHRKKSAKDNKRYSQREAVLTALRSLTRRNYGDDTEEWQPLKEAIHSTDTLQLRRR